MNSSQLVSNDSVRVPADRMFLVVLRPQNIVVAGDTSEDNANDFAKDMQAMLETYDSLGVVERADVVNAADFAAESRPSRRAKVVA